MGPHFFAMITIEWTYTSKDNWHAIHGAYMLKKRQMKERTLYKLYKNDDLILSTFLQHEFMREVRERVKGIGFSSVDLSKKKV